MKRYEQMQPSTGVILLDYLDFQDFSPRFFWCGQGEGVRMAMAFQHMSQYFAALKPGSLVLEAGLFVFCRC